MSKNEKRRKASRSANAELPDDFDFLQHLHDTIILLGGKKEIARLLMKSQDYQITRSDIDELRKYNSALIDQIKDRLANIHKIKVRTKSK
jgi:hypothetical protein